MRLSNGRVRVGSVRSKNGRMRVGYAVIEVLAHSLIESELQKRQESNVDPFQQGFEHKSDISSLDLSSVRLCFQAEPGTKINMQPTISNVIRHDKGQGYVE